jgi:arylsulfatase A-like enzyme
MMKNLMQLFTFRRVFQWTGVCLFTQTIYSQKPNIVYIFTDQQTASAMSCAGNPHISTPSMDKLANSGVRFVNAYCSSPLSTPSRFAMFTGITPGVTGNLKNGSSIPAGYKEKTLGSLILAVGYEVAYAGKWHIPASDIPDKEFGFTSLYGHKDSGLAEACVSFINKPHQKPFFLVAAFDNPHNICEYARQQKLPFKDVKQPDSMEDCPTLPSNFAIQPYDAKVIRFEQKANYFIYPTMDYIPDDWRRYRYAYYKMVEYVDSEIGKILDALEKNRLMDNTIILFTSDHGDGNGAHQWNQKSALYEEVVNIPFIIKDLNSKCGGSIDSSLVNNGVDMLPTLCTIAGVDIPLHCKGKNIPLFDKKKKTSRDYVVCETQFDRSDTKGWMVRSKRYKYIIYDKGLYREQLYDMTSDRGEMVNLAVSKDYKDILSQHRNYLKEWAEINNVKIARTILP